MKREVWIIELRYLYNTRSKWSPTGFSYSKSEARADLTDWIDNNPRYEFRLVKYVPVKP